MDVIGFRNRFSMNLQMPAFRVMIVGAFLAAALVLALLHHLSPAWGAISGLCVGIYAGNAKK
jgi:hypothetical protein